MQGKESILPSVRCTVKIMTGRHVKATYASKAYTYTQVGESDMYSVCMLHRSDGYSLHEICTPDTLFLAVRVVQTTLLLLEVT